MKITPLVSPKLMFEASGETKGEGGIFIPKVININSYIDFAKSNYKSASPFSSVFPTQNFRVRMFFTNNLFPFPNKSLSLPQQKS